MSPDILSQFCLVNFNTKCIDKALFYVKQTTENVSSLLFTLKKYFLWFVLNFLDFLQKCKDSMTLILLQKIGQNKG